MGLHLGRESPLFGRLSISDPTPAYLATLGSYEKYRFPEGASTNAQTVDFMAQPLEFHGTIANHVRMYFVVNLLPTAVYMLCSGEAETNNPHVLKTRPLFAAIGHPNHPILPSIK
jgi:hypothetical protein